MLAEKGQRHMPRSCQTTIDHSRQTYDPQPTYPQLGSNDVDQRYSNKDIFHLLESSGASSILKWARPVSLATYALISTHVPPYCFLALISFACIVLGPGFLTALIAFRQSLDWRLDYQAGWDAICSGNGVYVEAHRYAMNVYHHQNLDDVVGKHSKFISV